MRVDIAPQKRFSEAAEQWKQSRVSQISSGSLENYRQYIQSLNLFFGEMRLEDIHIGNVEEYQELRQETCGASRINHEISCLQQILKRAGLWEELRRYYEPMPLPASSPGVALEMMEEEHLFKTAAKKPKWKVAYCCALLSANTTMGPGEIRHLRLGNIDLQNRRVFIEEGVKNKFRVRTLPLNDEAAWALSTLLEVAHKHGSHLDDHHLLSYRPRVAGAKYDPLKPMGSWKTAWFSLRKEAGKRYPALLTLRRNDMRHHACTKLLEDSRVSERTIEEMMGHRLNSRTKERYSHIRMQKKIDAVEILSRTAPAAEPAEKKKPQAIDSASSSTLKYLFRFPS